MFRIRSELALSIHRYFQDRGFFYLQTPIITGSDCEGAGEMLRVTTLHPGQPLGPEGSKAEFFGKDAFLTVSGQLSAEPFALALATCILSAPPSGRNHRIPPATRPSSGWWSRRWPLPP